MDDSVSLPSARSASTSQTLAAFCALLVALLVAAVAVPGDSDPALVLLTGAGLAVLGLWLIWDNRQTAWHRPVGFGIMALLLVPLLLPLLNDFVGSDLWALILLVISVTAAGLALESLVDLSRDFRFEAMDEQPRRLAVYVGDVILLLIVVASLFYHQGWLTLSDRLVTLAGLPDSATIDLSERLYTVIMVALSLVGALVSATSSSEWWRLGAMLSSIAVLALSSHAGMAAILIAIIALYQLGVQIIEPDLPWTTAVCVLGTLLILLILVNGLYFEAFEFLLQGVFITVRATLAAFAIALIIGLSAGLARVAKNPIANNIATFYVEVIRGVPILVQIVFMAFVIFPALVDLLNSLGIEASVRDPLMAKEIRAILALAIAYGAYEAEVFRAGIQSIERGQMEAGRSLGMTYAQAMRYVVLPQAIRRVLPPLGNDFISMLKDSSLISVLAIRELTQLGDLHRSRTFRAFETLITVTVLYLSMTIALSMGVRALERRLSTDD